MEWVSSFFNIVVWGDDRAVVNKFEKGTTLHVIGRLDMREWTDKHDQKREDIQIIADTVTVSLPEPAKSDNGDSETQEEWQF